MFIPVGTDAPIYHFPFATIGIAVANVLVHVGLGAVAPDGDFALSPLKQDWSLWFGEGVHPLQWVTSCFLHGGWLHLVGNLIFLWGFGIIVEGKLGWWRFTLFYLAIGAIGCGIEQLALLPADFAPPGREEVERMLRDAGQNEDEIDRLLEGIPLPDHFVALGASGAIFGLVAVCMVWAPKNDLDVLWILWIRGGISEIPIYAFALLYVGLEAATLAFQASVLGREYAVSSALLHVVGALVGLAGGVLLLKRGWVDCENWDLFNVWRGTHGDRSELELHRKYSAELTVPSMSAGGGDGRDGVLPPRRRAPEIREEEETPPRRSARPAPPAPGGGRRDQRVRRIGIAAGPPPRVRPARAGLLRPRRVPRPGRRDGRRRRSLRGLPQDLRPRARVPRPGPRRSDPPAGRPPPIGETRPPRPSRRPAAGRGPVRPHAEAGGDVRQADRQGGGVKSCSEPRPTNPTRQRGARAQPEPYVGADPRGCAAILADASGCFGNSVYAPWSCS